MKMPTHCPFCSDPLLNEFTELGKGVSRLDKTCKRRVGHTIKFCSCLRYPDYVDMIVIPYSPTINCIWYVTKSSLLLNRNDGVDLRLPYFEPDFTSYRRLVEKLKTYVTFS